MADVEDGYNRADTVSGLGTADSGQVWSDVAFPLLGGGGPAWRIVDNQAVIDPSLVTGVGIVAQQVDTLGALVGVGCDAVIGTQTTTLWGIFGWGVDGDNLITGIVTAIDDGIAGPGNGLIEMIVFVAGTPTQFVADYPIAGLGEGTGIRCYLDMDVGTYEVTFRAVAGFGTPVAEVSLTLSPGEWTLLGGASLAGLLSQTTEDGTSVWDNFTTGPNPVSGPGGDTTSGFAPAVSSQEMPIASVVGPVTLLPSGALADSPEGGELVVFPALHFDATGGLEVIDHPVWNLESAWMWEFWIRTTHVPVAAENLIIKTAGGKINYRVRLLPSGRVDVARSDGTTTTTATSVVTVNDGTWRYVTAASGRVSPRTMEIQVEETAAVSVADVAIAGTTVNAGVVVIAQSDFVGDLDEIAFYPTPLTSTKRTRHLAAAAGEPI